MGPLSEPFLPPASPSLPAARPKRHKRRSRRASVELGHTRRAGRLRMDSFRPFGSFLAARALNKTPLIASLWNHALWEPTLWPPKSWLGPRSLPREAQEKRPTQWALGRPEVGGIVRLKVGQAGWELAFSACLSKRGQSWAGLCAVTVVGRS